jgi:hypothetical protein
MAASEDRGVIRFEVVPLEALRVGPGEVLILRLPSGADRSTVEQFRQTLKSLGLGDRLLLIANEVEAVVVEAESDAESGATGRRP